MLGNFLRRALGVIAIATLVFLTYGPVIHAQNGRTRGTYGWIPGKQVTEADLFRWITELSNWGRWGPDDGKGQSNFITPDVRIRAAGLVKLGITVSMERNVVMSTDPGASGTVMVRTVTTNGPTFFGEQLAYVGSFHGTSQSHWDALCHYFGTVLQGLSWNGNSVTAGLNPNTGCLKADIMAHQNGVLTRGIIFDAPAYMGVDYLPASTPIYWEDLEAMERLQGVTVEPGDAIFLYTGRWKRQAAGEGTGNAAGYHASVIQFLRDRQVSFIGGEEAQDVQPGGFPNFGSLPVHILALGVLGVGIFDALDLDDLVATARQLHRYDFMFTAAPLRIVGGTGGPVNPIATF
jgi:hypothetical protein